MCLGKWKNLICCSSSEAIKNPAHREHQIRKARIVNDAKMCGHAGELAVCFGPNEQEAFNLLCHHAMRNEAQRPLIKAMLELVARHLHYPSLADYVAINIVSFTHYWVGKQKCPFPDDSNPGEQVRNECHRAAYASNMHVKQ